VNGALFRKGCLRADCNWGSERAIEGAEQRASPYLCKLKQREFEEKKVTGGKQEDLPMPNSYWIAART
jgi:hypothetical protein